MPVSWNEIRQNAIRFSREWPEEHREDAEADINIKAVEILDELHDALADGGYTGHDLERFLVRILFCLFADDTGLFEPDAFTLYLENRTAKDGSDLGVLLAQLFEVLDTPPERRQKNLDEMLAAFKHVNGDLFKERLGFAAFNRAMRDALLKCTKFDWSRISPAVFGSLFQGIMEPKERRQTGGHYTSERDILKVVNALFMDDLRAEFGKARRSKAMLKQFQKKQGTLRFFDPACGCGNFLVITYRELRLLEIDVLKALYADVPQEEFKLDVQSLSCVDVDAFTGIEIQEWPARIAEVAMWLMEHQMNMRLSVAFGEYFARLPLKKSANIVLGNALRLDWKAILPPEQCSYVLGNPPFIGKHLMNAGQNEDMERLWKGVAGTGVLDYVTGWYKKAAEYIKGNGVVVGFVSTNSITQGEQAGVLWNALFQLYGVKIHFGHRTFAWQSEARGKAHVHVVIIGFANFDVPAKRIYDYEGGEKTATVQQVNNISPYLVEGADMAVVARSSPLCSVPACIYGNKPTDGGHLIVEEQDRAAFLSANPAAGKYVYPLLCAEEYLHSIPRWCLWLVDASPEDIRNISGIRQRVEAVRDFRQASKKEPTRRKADMAALFAEIRQPKSRYIVIPRHSSEQRKYVPFGYFEPEMIIHDSCTALPDASLYHFGVLSSSMHMAWMRQVCGRLESRYRYSSALVYNNFPWPQMDVPAQDQTTPDANASCVKEAAARIYWSSYHEDGHEPEHKAVRLTGDAKKKAAVEAKAEAVLVARARYPLSTLADLYDPVSMPADLVKAHADLDRAVERCYRAEPFTSDRQRVEFLFALHESITAPLLPAEKTKGRGRGKANQ